MTPRPNDIPKSFYPGMWLRRLSEGTPYTHPTAEVIRVGRTRVTLHESGDVAPVRLPFESVQKDFRKVYQSEAPELPDWLKEGAEFTVGEAILRLQRIRWSCASVTDTSGVLMFWRLTAILRTGTPRRSTWDRLRDEE